MGKELLVVMGSAAVGTWAVTRWGGKLESWAVAHKLPATIAHVGIVGGATGAAFIVARRFL